MTSQAAIDTGVLKKPVYFVADSTHVNSAVKDSIATRILLAALPFIALHKPFGRAIAIGLDGVRAYASWNLYRNNGHSRELVQTILIASAFFGTLFMHPLGLCIGALYDMGFDIASIVRGSGSLEVAFSFLSLLCHFAYLATMLFGSLEVVALSFLLQMAVVMALSAKEFQNDRWIEAIAHILMSCVRLSQALPYMDKVADLRQIRGKAHLHLVHETVAKIRDRAAIFFYSSARFFIKPHWKMTGMWIETISFYNDVKAATMRKASLLAQSVLASIALLSFAVGGLVVGQTLHFSAFLLGTTPYVYLQGNGSEKRVVDTFSLLQLNCCLPSGGFARIFGGTSLPNAERVAKIATMILEKSPDLVCLQEVSDWESGFALCSTLKSQYAHFFLRVGATPIILQNDSGLFVASKMAVSRPEFLSFSDIVGSEKWVNKGCFSFTTDLGHCLTTHLSPSADDRFPTRAEIQVREEEQARILSIVEKKREEEDKPTFIVGDWNIRWGGDEYRSSPLLARGLDPYNQHRQVVSDGDATAETNFLVQRNWHHNEKAAPLGVIIDYFLSFFSPNSWKINTQRVATFDVKNPESALSDHAVLHTEIKIV